MLGHVENQAVSITAGVMAMNLEVSKTIKDHVKSPLISSAGMSSVREAICVQHAKREDHTAKNNTTDGHTPSVSLYSIRTAFILTVRTVCMCIKLSNIHD